MARGIVIAPEVFVAFAKKRHAARIEALRIRLGMSGRFGAGQGDLQPQGKGPARGSAGGSAGGPPVPIKQNRGQR